MFLFRMEKISRVVSFKKQFSMFQFYEIFIFISLQYIAKISGIFIPGDSFTTIKLLNKLISIVVFRVIK